MNTFSELPLLDALQKSIAESGYTVPTPIQSKSIPYLLEKRDLLGCAQTGTGKTAAFALPILQNLTTNPRRANPRQTRTLILTPTRELAIQIHESFKTYGKYLRLKYAVVFGGVGYAPQVQAVAQGVDVLIATPGRLIDLIQQKHLRLNELEIFVLDEADRMLDMGFINDIRKIIALLPPKRQNLFFSATMPPDILQLSQSLLTDPVRVEVTPVSSTAEKINQSLYYVEKSKKRDLLRHVLQDKKLNKVIVFTRTKHGANRVVEVLVRNQISSAAIHGNKSQSARQRALEDFREGAIRVLVATDIAARGIDIDDISHVINFELPNISESYVHRIGRTARAGASGSAISFCDQEEKAYVRDIEKLIGKSIPVNPDHPYHSRDVEMARTLSKGKAKAQIESRDNQERGPRRPQQRRSQGGGGSQRPRSFGGSGSGGGRSGGRPQRQDDGPRRDASGGNRDPYARHENSRRDNSSARRDGPRRENTGDRDSYAPRATSSNREAAPRAASSHRETSEARPERREPVASTPQPRRPFWKRKERS